MIWQIWFRRERNTKISAAVIQICEKSFIAECVWNFETGTLICWSIDRIVNLVLNFLYSVGILIYLPGMWLMKLVSYYERKAFMKFNPSVFSVFWKKRELRLKFYHISFYCLAFWEAISKLKSSTYLSNSWLKISFILQSRQ